MNTELTSTIINECSQDMCFYENCSVKGRCHELNCETTWAAIHLLRKGWVKQKYTTRGLHLGHQYYCSNCGELSYMHNYCASCGAKVKESDNEGNN